MAETLAKSRHDTQLFVVGMAKNPGIFSLSEDYVVGDICDCRFVQDYALHVKPDFAIIGPEAPIAAGVVDALIEVGVHSASPLATVGRLESSKSFTRDLVEKYGIEGNPKFKVFFKDSSRGLGGTEKLNKLAELNNFFDQLGEDFVVKADGLKGGKGVKVSGDHFMSRAEGVTYALECLAEAPRVVVEEKLIGQEFSLMSFCDGKTTCDMPAVQDHKRAFEGDCGPNTGGMGTYSCANHSLPFLTSRDVEEACDITRKVANALFEETGSYFKGVMYGGFIATAKGVRLIEYNARFGDPEAMNVLPIMKTDFVDVCEAIISGNLRELKVEFENKATVCKYVVPEGYPDKPIKGEKITIGEMPDGVKTYFASVDLREDGLYLGGSRAVACVGIADDLEKAEKLAEKAVVCVQGPVFHRRDIGTKELIEKRVKMMKELRGKSDN